MSTTNCDQEEQERYGGEGLIIEWRILKLIGLIDIEAN